MSDQRMAVRGGRRASLRTLMVFGLLWKANQSTFSSPAPQEVQDARMARQIVATQMVRNFEVSLGTKESVDFLLTPALLVQEFISSRAVPTYPAE